MKRRGTGSGPEFLLHEFLPLGGFFLTNFWNFCLPGLDIFGGVFAIGGSPKENNHQEW